SMSITMKMDPRLREDDLYRGSLIFLDLLERPQYVEHAVTLEALLAVQVGRALAQDLLDAARLPDQLRVAGHEHGRRSAHVGGCHAGAVEVAPFAFRKRRAYA